ncbi:MAG TPA: UDP-N-acetylmuramate dehydrogenase [Gemmatimonadales bacterium]|nr:UDP-N-acetylmuramate dehydrogenase [Gemmatimonadales bacterium]
MTTALAELRSRVRGTVRYDEPLARYTTYRLGGPAAALVEPRSVEDVVAALAFAREAGLPWLALGLGSNVLISDAGFEGVVVRVGKGLDEVRVQGPDTWTVGAGLPTPLLAKRSAGAGLAGAQRMIGVPGTVGGGVFMNAGAHGQDFSLIVRSVELVQPDGTTSVLEGSNIPWRYRSAGIDACVIVGVTLQFTPGDPRELQADIRRHLEWRKAGTPFDQPCCGSVFRNPSAPSGAVRAAAAAPDARPPGMTAGQLIDAAGLKGFRIGGAQVSAMHANYIVNLGTATAADVKAVIDAVRQRVFAEFGVELELEVRIIG